MSILITGASAGFGRAMVQRLASEGQKVIALARRASRLAALAAPNVYPLALDLCDPEAVAALPAQLPPEFSEVEVLINNAGLALGLEAAEAAELEDWQVMIDTNVSALVRITRAFLPAMVARKRGYIINIGSIAGTYPYPGGNVYGATKAFVRQFSLNLRADLQGKGIRVSNIEPGLAGGTEFSQVRFRGDSERAEALYRGAEALTPEDIAETVSWLLSLPEHVNVNRLEIMPTRQAFGALPVTRD